ncbi:hypothetical protein SBV1_1220057 [Verrucomicrobia bacterium]|nr:hypothetical protein SBV1_1220057 [Verrucomicrobiota bacterium]
MRFSNCSTAMGLQSWCPSSWPLTSWFSGTFSKTAPASFNTHVVRKDAQGEGGMDGTFALSPRTP